MAARSRLERRRRAPARSADLISGLCDDVLLRILDRLPDTADAVRTGVLSRRWRGLWTRASSLTFDSSSSSSSRLKSNRGFLDLVHAVLAQRAESTDAAAALDHLAISFAFTVSPARGLHADNKPLVLQSADAAREWIWHAMQNGAKSFDLTLQLLPIWNCYRRLQVGAAGYREVYQPEQPMVDLTDLPASGKLETMRWNLGGVRLQLPVAAVFASLVDLSIEDIHLPVDDRLIARLLSSACCPSLQRLRLRNLMLPLLNELVIEAAALLELTMSSEPSILGPVTLKLKTPRLRSLHIEDVGLGTLGISAPRLEELTFLPNQPNHIEVDGELPCVESLRKVALYSHRNEEFSEDDINNNSIYLLSCCCTSLTSLEVSLKVTMGEGFSNIISGTISHLPHLISLTVHVDSRKLHSFGVGLAEILKQCSYLKYLRVYCIQMAGCDHDNDYFCGHPDHCKSHQMYLANIQEVCFTGLAGTECENWFMKRVLAYATQLQKVALSFDPRFTLHNMTNYFGFIPCSGGTWICHDPRLSYEWSCDPTRK